jgi:ABC-type antimicrobial peptide transport system permease subunit
MLLMSVFAALALTLAALGIYSVMSYGVNQRRQEISVRMALGATPGHVLRLFLGHGLIVAAAGIGCGMLAALAASKALESLVFGVKPTDAATLGTVAALLMVVTLAASYLPARSATRVDPLEGLRSE